MYRQQMMKSQKQRQEQMEYLEYQEYLQHGAQGQGQDQKAAPQEKTYQQKVDERNQEIAQAIRNTNANAQSTTGQGAGTSST